MIGHLPHASYHHINWNEMHWYMTVTHISDCEINSVALITMPLICKCYKNGLCNITDSSNKFILSALLQ